MIPVAAPPVAPVEATAPGIPVPGTAPDPSVGGDFGGLLRELQQPAAPFLAPVILDPRALAAMLQAALAGAEAAVAAPAPSLPLDPAVDLAAVPAGDDASDERRHPGEQTAAALVGLWLPFVQPPPVALRPAGPVVTAAPSATGSETAPAAVVTKTPVEAATILPTARKDAVGAGAGTVMAPEAPVPAASAAAPFASSPQTVTSIAGQGLPVPREGFLEVAMSVTAPVAAWPETVAPALRDGPVVEPESAPAAPVRVASPVAAAVATPAAAWREAMGSAPRDGIAVEREGFPEAPVRVASPVGSAEAAAARVTPADAARASLGASRDEDPGSERRAGSGREPVEGPSGAAAPTASPRAERATGPAPDAAGAAPRPLVEQIVTRLTPLREGRQEIALRLDPPELGGLRIEATLEGGQLSLRITAEQEAARHTLEGALPRLRESLAQQGLVADRITVQLGLDASARDSGGGSAFARPLAPAPEPVTRAAAPAPRLSRGLPTSTEGLDLWA